MHLKDEDSFFYHVDGSVLAIRINVNPLFEPFWMENRRDLRGNDSLTSSCTFSARDCKPPGCAARAMR